MEYYDTSLKSFGIEIRHSGGKTYFTRFRNQNGKDRQFKLGDANVLTLTQAKLLATKIQAKVAMGVDPSAERKESLSVPSFAVFIEQRYLPYVKGYKKAANSDVSYLNNQILPVLGKKYLDEITKKDIIDFHHGLKAKGYKPGTCNRSLILLRYAFNLAIRWETPGIKANPTIARHMEFGRRSGAVIGPHGAACEQDRQGYVRSGETIGRALHAPALSREEDPKNLPRPILFREPATKGAGGRARRRSGSLALHGRSAAPSSRMATRSAIRIVAKVENVSDMA